MLKEEEVGTRHCRVPTGQHDRVVHL